MFELAWSRDITIFTEISIKPSTETILLVPSTFSMTDHYDLVDHFSEIQENTGFQFQSHGNNAGIESTAAERGNGRKRRTKDRVTLNEQK